MSNILLPVFKYHPDPLDTGIIVQSETECICCGQSRGFIYIGPIYSEEDYDECICPWCIADGTAHTKLGLEFHDPEAVGISGFSPPSKVSRAAIDEICYRTPGFNGWQQEQWFTCCGDAAAFLGRAGQMELTSRWPQAIEAIRETVGLEGKKWDDLIKTLDCDESPTAYVFRCLHCDKYGGYQDSD
jgi:uncharacterized protein CbrC (UPF0167 family)